MEQLKSFKFKDQENLEAQARGFPRFLSFNQQATWFVKQSKDDIRPRYKIIVVMSSQKGHDAAVA